MISPVRLYVTQRGEVTTDERWAHMLLVGAGCETNDPRVIGWLNEHRPGAVPKDVLQELREQIEAKDAEIAGLKEQLEKAKATRKAPANKAIKRPPEDKT